jgi:hypothetical protein
VVTFLHAQMGSHGARRGDDDVWERARAGDIDSVIDHLSDVKKEKRKKKDRVLQAKHGEMWFDESLGHQQRRRTSVNNLISGMLLDDSAPLHQVDVLELDARNSLYTSKKHIAKSIADRFNQAHGQTVQHTTNQQDQPHLTPSTEQLQQAAVILKGSRPVVGSLFDHIFVRPMAPRDIQIKYEKYKTLLPLLQATTTAHTRGETNVATHMRNATVLTKSYQKYRHISPNLLLASYSDKVKLRTVAEQFNHHDSHTDRRLSIGQTKNTTITPISSSFASIGKTMNDVDKALRKLENSTFALSRREKYTCFSSKFVTKTVPKRKKRKRKRKSKRKIENAG